jgi:hypothetical protein
MKSSILTLFLATLAVQNGLSQSLDPQSPAPLNPGPNSSMVDTTVGTQYWYFWAGPGQVRVHARWFRGQFDVGQPAPLDVAVYDENRNSVTRRQITPQRETSEATADLNLKQRTKLFVSISAPRGSLLRMGGDYEIIASGAVDFTASSAPRTEPIVRTYSNGDFGAVRFDANGTLETEDGRRGTWRIFDPARAVYVIAIENRRISAKLMPGQGLVNPANPSDILFREVH